MFRESKPLRSDFREVTDHPVPHGFAKLVDHCKPKLVPSHNVVAARMIGLTWGHPMNAVAANATPAR